MQPRLAVLCLIPLELGGASTVANLWPEPWADPRGAHRKDDLENALNRQVCSGWMTVSPVPANGPGDPSVGRATSVDLMGNCPGPGAEPGF